MTPASSGSGKERRGPSLSERAYRLLLVFYPAEFRADYGRDAGRLFARLHEETWRQRGVPGLLTLWARSVVQVLVQGLRERLAIVGGHLGWGSGSGGRRRRPSDEDARNPERRLASGIDLFLQDLRCALRAVARRPGFALLAVVIIGLGVGATATIFSVVDGVLLRPLPYPSSGRLVLLEKEGHNVPVPDYRDWRDRASSFEAWGASRTIPAALTGSGDPLRLTVALVTPDLFGILGARPARGRLLTRDDFEASAPRVGVLSHELWMERWGGDPAVIGRTITVGGQPVVVVGVLAGEFIPPEALDLAGADLYVALDLNDPGLQSRRLSVLRVVARLRPEISFREARAELDVLGAAMVEEYPKDYVDPDGTPVSIDLFRMDVATVGEIGPTLYMFLGAVALLLLIACANVANLFLARGADRADEMAVRAALGADRRRIVAQLLTESGTIALLGGALGAALAYWGVAAFRAFNPGGIPRLNEVTVDWRVLAFALALAALSGVGVGLLPALRSSRADAGGLHAGSVRATAGRRRLRLRNALVVAEIGLALMLLVGAGLLFNSFLRLQRVDTGFEPEGVLTHRLSLGSAYEGEARLRFAAELLERTRGLPGVRAAGASWQLPYAGGRCCFESATWAVSGGDTLSSFIHPVTAGYFDALGASILVGRGLGPEDQAVDPVPFPSDQDLAEVGGHGESGQLATIPAVASRALVDALWPDRNPLGERIRLRFVKAAELEVVGVIDGIRHWGLDTDLAPDLYVPFDAFGGWIGILDVAVRYEGSPAPLAEAMRRAVAELDPNLPAGEIESMEARVARSMTVPRFYSLLLGVFAAIAFILAAGGIYGSMLYSVSRRQREMGIRLALGARGAALVRMVLGTGLALTALGIAVGLAGALALSGLLGSLVFGITPTDPATYVSVSALLAAVALLACYLPARRAARADPVETLRAE